MSGTLAELTGCLGGVKERGGMTRSVRSRYALCFCSLPLVMYFCVVTLFFITNFMIVCCWLSYFFVLGHFLFALAVFYLSYSMMRRLRYRDERGKGEVDEMDGLVDRVREE